MDALQFDYPDYLKISEEAAGVKRKRNVSIMKRQAVRSVKEKNKKEMTTKQKREEAEEGESSHSGPKSPPPKKQRMAKPDRASKKPSELPKKVTRPPRLHLLVLQRF
jgi:hypothetical protein